VAATTGLHDDLGLDSIQLFQALMVIEDLANSEIASTEVPALDTLGDAFAYYQQLCSSALSTSGTK
jgi:acyl carrier protein